MRIRRLVVTIALVATAACGRKEAPPPPLAVPTDLVPPTLGIADLSIAEDDVARDAFTKVGKEALIADGRLWTIRRGEVLVATLQIATAKSKIDLRKKPDRDAIGSKIVPSSADTISVEDIDVQATKANDKSTYLWFTTDLFEVLQVKSTKFGPEDLLRELITFQKTRPGWHPLRTDEEEVIE